MRLNRLSEFNKNGGESVPFLLKSNAVDKMKQYNNIVIIFVSWYYWGGKLQYSLNCTCLTTAHSVSLHELTISDTPGNKAVAHPSFFYYFFL